MVTTDIYSQIVASAQQKHGIRTDHIMAKGGKAFAVAGQVKETIRVTTMWSEHEDNYLRKNLGFLSEKEMANHLGRTVTAVHLRWKRDLMLTAPSKHPDWITANQVAEMLSLDSHKIAHWCDVGLIPHRVLPNDRRMRMIHKAVLKRWIVNTNNWIYFNWKKVRDTKLRRLCELRAERWGDEWLPTAVAAKYHNVTSKDVLRLILRDELPGVQVVTSLGGRHKDPRWLNWFVRKSDILKAHFVRGKGSGTTVNFSERAIAWMLECRKNGWTWAGIRRSMGSKCTEETIKKKVLSLTS